MPTTATAGQNRFCPIRIIGKLNVEFWEKHQNTPLIEAKTMLKESHKNVMALIETLSNDELFAKNSLAWTGTSTLGAYCVSTTSSHYDWAIKKLKKHRFANATPA